MSSADNRPPAAHAVSHPGFAARVSLFFAAIFLIYGVHVSYLPVWLHGRGLSPSEIGMITALPIFLRVVLTPAISARADTGGLHRRFVVGLSLLGVLLLALMMLGTGYGYLLATVVPFSIAVTSIMPLTETIAVSGVREAGLDYGRMRLWGSIAFLVATVAAGRLSDIYGASSIIYVLLLATLATAACSVLLPDPMGGISDPGASKDYPDGGLSRALLGTPKFAIFIFAVGCILCSHAAFYTFGAIHLGLRGISGQEFGILWGVSVLAETVLLWYSAAILRHVKPLQLVMLAALAGMVRWGGMSLDPPFAVLMGLQTLHGLTYGATHLGAIHFMARAVPHRCAGAAQGIYSAIGSGMFTGMATLAAGQLYPVLGGGTFLVMAGISTAGFAAALVLSRTWDGKPILEAPDINPIAPAKGA